MILTYPLPEPLIGDNLEAELAATGIPSAVTAYEDHIEVLVPEGTDEQSVAAVVQAHTGMPTPEQQAQIDAESEADQTVRDLEPILAKCRQVVRGEGSFTNAQRDRLLAGLVLVVHRRLSR